MMMDLGMAYTLTRDLIEQAEINGGHTIYLTETSNVGRYVVGGLVGTHTIDPDEYGSLEYAADWVATRWQPGVSETLGSWVNPDGRIDLDYGTTYESLDAALDVARARGELAIYDRLTGDCIDVK